MKLKELLSKIDQTAVLDAIRKVESESSGELRIHFEPKVRGEVRDFAERTFERLGMTKTKQRNGVLLFVAAENRAFVILGDKAIHAKVGDSFWDRIVARLSTQFREGKFTEGIVEAIGEIGAVLRDAFPPIAGDVDELPNELSVGDATDPADS